MAHIIIKGMYPASHTNTHSLIGRIRGSTVESVFKDTGVDLGDCANGVVESIGRFGMLASDPRIHISWNTVTVVSLASEHGKVVKMGI